MGSVSWTASGVTAKTTAEITRTKVTVVSSKGYDVKTKIRLIAMGEISQIAMIRWVNIGIILLVLLARR